MKKISKNIILVSNTYNVQIYKRMETRQQKRENEVYEKNVLYEVNIDFDGASEAWKANKKSTGNGCYKYVCGDISLKTGKKCMRELKDTCDSCYYHRKK